MISQTFKNLAADNDIAGLVPKAFAPLEVVAAASVKARELSGHDDPDRHAYLEAIPAYLKSLPQSVSLALDIIKIDAAAVLGVPGLTRDHAELSTAQAKLADAEAQVAAAEAMQGRRLARINQLEAQITDAKNQLAGWEFDAAALIADAEEHIVNHYGTTTPCGRPFEMLEMVPILERLKPQALAKIKLRIDAAEAELAELRADTVKRRA